MQSSTQPSVVNSTLCHLSSVIDSDIDPSYNFPLLPGFFITTPHPCPYP